MNLFQLATRGVDLSKLPDEEAPRQSVAFEPSTNGGKFSVPTDLNDAFEFAAKDFGIDPDVLRAVAYAESRFHPDVVSGKVKSKTGATGLMQFMPKTAQEYGIDPLDPVQSIFGAAAYLRKSLDRFDGNYGKAVASYNAGPNRQDFDAEDWDARMPAETQGYLRTVFTAADQLKQGGAATAKPVQPETQATKLPAGVKPSTAGGGRGSVSPGDINTKLTRTAVPDMTTGSVAQDIGSGLLQVGPTAVKGVGELVRLATGDRMGKGITDFAEQGIKSVQEVVGSDRAAAQRQNLNADMADDSISLGQAIANNKGALSDQIIPTLGSMAIPLGVAGAAGKVATLGRVAQGMDKAALVARVASVQQAAGIGATAAQNAASTFAELVDKGVSLPDAYTAAGITVPFSLLAGKLTGGGAEGALIKGLSGQSIAKGAVELAKAPVREGFQEGGEALGQVTGEVVGANQDISLQTGIKRVGTEALLGTVVGGGTGAVQQLTAPTVESQPTTPQAPTVPPAAPNGTATQAVDNIAALLRQTEENIDGASPVDDWDQTLAEINALSDGSGQSESAQSLKATSFAQRTATPTPLPGAVPSTTSADAGVRAMVEGIKKKRAQDAEETAQIQQMLAEDDAKAAALVASSVDETARGQAAQIAMQSRARLVDELVSSYAEPSDFFASRVLPAVDKQLAVLGRPPLAPEERKRIDSLLGSTRAFIRPSLPSAPEGTNAFPDVGADNASMESLIKEKQPKPAATGLAAEMAALKSRSNKPRQNKAPKPLLTDGERDMLADFERMYQSDVKGEIKTRLGLIPARQDEATPPAEKRNPSELLAAIKRAGGIKSTNAGDLMGGSAMDANRILPGLFKKDGMNLDLLVPFLKERGYLTQADEDSIKDNVGVNKLAEILQAELSGDRAQTVDSTAGYESDAEAAMRSDLDSKAFALGLPMKVTNEMSTERLNGVINRIERKLGKPVNTDFATRKMSRTEAMAERQAILMADRVERARAQYDADIQAFAEADDAVQDAVLEIATDADGNVDIVYTRAVDAASAADALNGQWSDQNAEIDTSRAGASQENSGQVGRPVATGARAGAGNPEANRTEAGAGQEGLTSYTPEEVTARQQATAQAEAATKRAEDAAARAEAAAKQASEIAQRSVAAADTFELGGNAEDNLSGQQGLKFSRASDGKAARAALAKIMEEGVTSPDDLRDLLRVPGYSKWAKSTIAGDVAGAAALRRELQDAFPGSDWKAPKLIDQGIITIYPDWDGLTSQNLDKLTRIADKYDAPIGVRGGAATKQLVNRLDGFGFELYSGLQERADRMPNVMFGMIRPAGGITTTTPLFSQGAKSPRTPISTITQAITKAYGNLLTRLEGKGLVSLTQTEEEAIAAAAQARADQNGGDVEAIKESLRKSVLASEASDIDVKRSADGSLEGFFDPATGKSFLIADNLTAESAPGALMHEVGIHMAADGKLEPLFTRAGNLLKMARDNEFIQRVQARMDQAGETSNEEAAAYIVTEYENDRTNAPASVGKWIKDFIADVRAWLFNKGVLLKADQLTVADIAAVARANANRMAKGDANGDVRYSKAAPTDPANPDIRFIRGAGSKQAQQNLALNTPSPAWMLPASTKTDALVYELQDQKVDLKRTQDAIAEAGRTITEPFDARMAETLMPGRVAYRTETFLKTEVAPLMEAMAKNNVTQNELSDYLLARHAPERNAQIAKVNPEMPDGGAGTNSQGVLMTTQAAQDHIAALTTGKRMVLQLLANKIDAITASTRDLLVREGLEKQSTMDAWTGAYKHYVPLFKDEAVESPAHPIGSGMSVTGSASKRAMGSEGEVTNMVAHILMQREAAITRAEKNRVAMSLYGLALSNPNQEVWTTIRPNMRADKIGAELAAMGVDPVEAEQGMQGVPTIRTVNAVTGLVQETPNPMYKRLENALVVKVDGEDRVVLFNAKNADAMRMVRALKNQDGLTNFDLAGSMVGTATRYFASINTQYNPAFGMVNVVRDIGGALVNLTTTGIADKKAKVLGDIPAAMKGIARDVRGDQARTPWSDLWVQFQEDGGRTGYRDLFIDPFKRAEAVQKDLDAMQRDGTASAGRVAHSILDLLDDFNTTLENGVRLSAYKAALDKGMSRPAAAKMARELTVDFNRKGRTGREVGPLYAFFNASVQGTARTIESLKGPAGKKIIAGGLMLGVIQSLMLAAAGFDDDEPPEFVKARSFIIPMGDKKYIAIPLQFGLNALPNTGRVITDLLLTGGKDAGKKTFNAIGEIMGSFNPLGGGNIFTAHGLLTTVAPTVADPLVDLATNTNFAGTPIGKDRADWDTRPGAKLARESTQRSLTGQAYIGISKAINAASGGNEFKKGLASPTPEQVQYVFTTAGGGLYRELEKTLNIAGLKADGFEIKPRMIPLGGRFAGEADDQDTQRSRYYRNSERLAALEAELKGFEKDGNDSAVNRIEAERSDEVDLLGDYKHIRQAITKLNKLAADNINDVEMLKELDAERLELMRELNDSVRKLEKRSELFKRD